MFLGVVAEVKVFSPAFGQTPAPKRGADFAFAADFGAEADFEAGLADGFLAAGLAAGFLVDGGILISLRSKGGEKILCVRHHKSKLRRNANETTTP